MSETARRNPGAGALITSQPLISVLGMICLWRDPYNPARMAAHAAGTFLYDMRRHRLLVEALQRPKTIGL